MHNRRSSIRSAVLGTAVAIGLAAGATAAHAANVADTLASDTRFPLFVGLIQRAGLTDTLKTASQVTVFAPTDGAFTRVPASMLQDLTPQAGSQSPSRDSQQLQALIRIHLIANAVAPSAFIGQRQTIVDEAGTSLIVDGTQSGILTITTVPANVGGPNIGGVTTPRTANVVGQEIVADNGVIYPIDNVLIQ
jgi:uncharacterized surface protein with fasciclin (FAS1) repeats